MRSQRVEDTVDFQGLQAVRSSEVAGLVGGLQHAEGMAGDAAANVFRSTGPVSLSSGMTLAGKFKYTTVAS